MPALARSSVTKHSRQRTARAHMRSCLAAAGLAAMLLSGVTTPASPQSIIAVVNGLPITDYDIEQRTRLLRLSTRKTHSRQEVLDELINEKIKLREATRWGITVENADVDNAFANMAKGMGLNAQQFTQALNAQGVNASQLKARVRADLSWANLVRGRFQSTLQVGDRDIQSILDRKPDENKETTAFEYTLRPILFIVQQGSPSSMMDVRRREADALRSRFRGCDDGIAFARALRDVAVREPIIRSSAELPPPLRTMLNSLEIGQLTAPETTPQGVQLFALCGKRTTQTDSPQKRAARAEVYSKKFEAQSKRYLEQVRGRAMIEYK